jgi:hypothetical protein
VGPVTPADRLRVTTPAAGGEYVLKIERQKEGAWEAVFEFDGVQANTPTEVAAGQGWVPLNNVQGAQEGLVTRRVVPNADANALLPCLIVLVGSQARELNAVLHPFAAAILEIDDRPITSGDLPDFWQRNVARIVAGCLENPNIRTILLVRGDVRTVALTRKVLLGACVAVGHTEGGEPPVEWTDDRVGEIALATTLRSPQLHHFKDRKIGLIETDAGYEPVIKAILEVCRGASAQLAARGRPESASWKSDVPNGLSNLTHTFAGANVSDVFPRVIAALRDRKTPRYVEPSGEELAELTTVRVELQAPKPDDIPGYWQSDRQHFEAYYARTFKPEGLFGKRFYRWGEGGGVDQVTRAIDEATTSIEHKRVNRRIQIATAQPPGDTASDPLGLVSVHILPRLRAEQGSWVLDFVWVWRSVEAIVGFPFSAFGSVRFSSDVLERVNAKVSAPNRPVRLGTVTYLAISLHLFCEPADLAIARYIDLEARP